MIWVVFEGDLGGFVGDFGAFIGDLPRKLRHQGKEGQGKLLSDPVCRGLDLKSLASIV